jgi:peptide-methionine (S)-S-oxide reductase
VVRTRVGYAGGSSHDPTYHRLGDHTETVEIDYDPAEISYRDLLDEFWRAHDPRHPSHSVQYRSAVFYRTEDERRAAEESKGRIEAAIGPVTTAIEPLRRFYRAEDYHQKYRLRGERGVMSGFRAMFPDESAFVDSTAAARVNGWLYGYGEPSLIESDLPRLGLDAAASDTLRRLVLHSDDRVSTRP